jgi:hypothetical protein
MKSSDIAKRLSATTSRQCLEEWEKGVISGLLQSIARDVLYTVSSSKNTVEQRRAGETKRLEK